MSTTILALCLMLIAPEPQDQIEGSLPQSWLPYRSLDNGQLPQVPSEYNSVGIGGTAPVSTFDSPNYNASRINAAGSDRGSSGLNAPSPSTANSIDSTNLNSPSGRASSRSNGQPMQYFKPAQYQSNLDHAPIASAKPIPSALEDSTEVELPKFKKQALQKIAFSGGWLGATSRNDLSSTFASLGVTFGMPLGSMDNLLAVTPSFRCDWIDASSAIEVPSQLYDVSLDLFHTRKINDRWKMLAMVRPSYRSDFRASRDSVKVFGLGVFIWDYVPDRLAVSLGAVYLGRSDIPALPVVGLTWTPNTQTRFEFQFPRTRALRRLRKNGAESELWSYLTVGIGGNTWAVKRDSGASDQVALKDVRITTGIERIVAGGGGFFLETGLALNRSIEYLSDPASQVSLSNGVLFSGGWTY